MKAWSRSRGVVGSGLGLGSFGQTQAGCFERTAMRVPFGGRMKMGYHLTAARIAARTTSACQWLDTEGACRWTWHRRHAGQKAA